MNVAINMTTDGLALSSHHAWMPAGNQFPIQGGNFTKEFFIALWIHFIVTPLLGIISPQFFTHAMMAYLTRCSDKCIRIWKRM